MGIIDRWTSPWNRPDNSSGQALETYTELATWFHLKLLSEQIPQVATARDSRGWNIGIHLLPRPEQPRLEDSQPVQSRDYLVKIKAAILV